MDEGKNGRGGEVKNDARMLYSAPTCFHSGVFVVAFHMMTIDGSYSTRRLPSTELSDWSVGRRCQGRSERKNRGHTVSHRKDRYRCRLPLKRKNAFSATEALRFEIKFIHPPARADVPQQNHSCKSRGWAQAGGRACGKCGGSKTEILSGACAAAAVDMSPAPVNSSTWSHCTLLIAGCEEERA